MPFLYEILLIFLEDPVRILKVAKNKLHACNVNCQTINRRKQFMIWTLDSPIQYKQIDDWKIFRLYRW